jgi:mannosyltransferase OCH1-like enzyme
LIPKRIHYCWFGDDAQPPEFERYYSSWRRLLSDFEIHRWDSTNVSLSNDYLRAAYARKAWSRLSNLVRLEVLLREGGVYLDVDVEVVKSFDSLLGLQCVVGFQTEHARRESINNAVIAAQAGSVFLRDCRDTTLRCFRQSGVLPRGPAVMSAVLRRYGLRKYGSQTIGEVTLLPREAFYPYGWDEHFSPGCVTPNTYCIHHWAGSWIARRSFATRVREKIAHMLL